MANVSSVHLSQCQAKALADALLVRYSVAVNFARELEKDDFSFGFQASNGGAVVPDSYAFSLPSHQMLSDAKVNLEGALVDARR